MPFNSTASMSAKEFHATVKGLITESWESPDKKVKLQKGIEIFTFLHEHRSNWVGVSAKWEKTVTDKAHEFMTEPILIDFLTDFLENRPTLRGLYAHRCPATTTKGRMCKNNTKHKFCKAHGGLVRAKEEPVIEPVKTVARAVVYKGRKKSSDYGFAIRTFRNHLTNHGRYIHHSK